MPKEVNHLKPQFKQKAEDRSRTLTWHCFNSKRRIKFIGRGNLTEL